MTEFEVRQRVAKLMAIYEKHPNTAEGKNALRHAKRLIDKHKLNQTKPKATPKADPQHPLAGITTAIRDLINTKPSKDAVPDIGELDRKLTELLRRSRVAR